MRGGAGQPALCGPCAGLMRAGPKRVGPTRIATPSYVVCHCYVVPKFANYNLCKSSLVGYILIALELQDKF